MMNLVDAWYSGHGSASVTYPTGSGTSQQASGGARTAGRMSASAFDLASTEQLYHQLRISQYQQSLQQDDLAAAESADPSHPHNADLTQIKVQNTLLRKEIQALREQNIHLQSTITKLETGLCQDALHSTTLEQSLRNEEFKVLQLQEGMKSMVEKVAYCQAEVKRMKGDWDAERQVSLVQMNETLRAKDEELRAVIKERDTVRDISDKKEFDFEKERMQFRTLLEQCELDKTELRAQLRDASNRANELSGEERRVKAENTALQATLLRTQEKLAKIEEECLLSQKAAEENLLQEMHRHDAELDKNREEVAAARANTEARVQRLTDEIATVRSRSLETEKALTAQVVDMQVQCDHRVEQARQAERDRSEALITNLKLLLETSSSSQKEFESQCEKYLTELKEAQEGYQKSCVEMKEKMQTLEAEAERLRALNVTMKDTLSAAQTESSLKVNECEQAQFNLQREKSLREDSERRARELDAERTQLKAQLRALRKDFDTLVQSKQRDFSTIEESLKDSLVRELGNLRMVLIPNLTASTTTTNSSSESSDNQNDDENDD